MAVRHFEDVRRRLCRHLQWAYDMPLPSVDKGVEETLWVALSSTCRVCHWAYVSLHKATYLAWKGYVPLKCVHGGELWDLEGQPEGARQVAMTEENEPLIPQDGAVHNQGEITVEVL